MEGLVGEGCRFGLEGGIGDSDEHLHFWVSSGLPKSTEEKCCPLSWSHLWTTATRPAGWPFSVCVCRPGPARRAVDVPLLTK